MNEIVNKELPQIQENLKKFAIKLTKNKDKAIELVSATNLRILEKQDLYKYDAHFSTWCTNIMYNLFIDQCRKDSNKGIGFITYTNLFDDAGDSINEGEERLNIEEIYHCIDLLKESDKQLILRKIEEKLSFKELASIYGVEANSIRPKYYAAIRRLKDIMVERGFSEPETPPRKQ